MTIYNFYNPGTDHPKWTKMEEPDVELKGTSYRWVNLKFFYITSFETALLSGLYKCI